MANLSFTFSAFLLLHHHLLFSSTISEAKTEHRSNDRVSSLFIFGDSFLDAGNNNYINTTTLDQANFLPYGETYFRFPTGRFSDGRLLSDFIAEYANLPLIPTFLQPPGTHRNYSNGVNFASAGAGALVETFKGFVIDLKTQVMYYKKVENWLRCKLGNNEAKLTLSHAVYFFSIGTNDYINPFLTNSTLLNSYSNSIHVEMEIYKIGGRKFAFINLPALGCLPAMRILEPGNNGKCLEEASNLASLHNKALYKVLVEMEEKLKGFKYSLFDLETSLRQMMNHPSKYGMKEGKRACCGTGKYRGVFSCGGKRIVKKFELCKNPNEYVFWDSFHLTEMSYKQMSFQMWAGDVSTTIGPYNLNQLFHI
ncbi:GDSL esterase/lipase 5 isoform X2 [Euphorbia lathyris]|uniref:GDSL esterase/lipase 5 isoform X2 n=1 Tax=Euphorbia lathyris TaxID=212925 RepID=UPI003314437C